MKRNRKIARVLCLAVLGTALLGTAIEARADCQYVRGGITETRIPSPNDLGRVLGIVTGVLNGASTAFITSLSPGPFGVLNATSFDVFVTNRGDMLTATGAVTLTPVPGKPPGEFTVHVDLTITGGSGKYEGATGTMTFEGLSHSGTADVIYQGSVCSPNLKAGGN